MYLRRRLTARNVSLALLTWLLVSLGLHLKTEHPNRLSSSVGSSTQHLNELTNSSAEVNDAKLKSSSDVSSHGSDDKENARRTAVVVAKSEDEDARWLYEHFPQWEKYVYEIDNPAAELKVPKNKGRESMAYLT